MKVLALDLGTKTGYAIGTKDDLISSGMQDWSPGRDDSTGMRFVRFYKWLNDQNKMDMVVYEKVERHLSAYAGHVYGGFLYVLQMWCIQNEVDYTGVGAKVIKKFATGNGNAKKDDMIKAAESKFNLKVESDDHADAIHIYDYAKSNILP